MKQTDYFYFPFIYLLPIWCGAAREQTPATHGIHFSRAVGCCRPSNSSFRMEQPKKTASFFIELIQCACTVPPRGWKTWPPSISFAALACGKCSSHGFTGITREALATFNIKIFLLWLEKETFRLISEATTKFFFQQSIYWERGRVFLSQEVMQKIYLRYR